MPFKWITPGGFAATVLILLPSAALGLYVDNLGPYNQIYGQVGAIIVLMLWLYSTGLMVLIGAEMTPCWPAWQRSEGHQDRPAASLGQQEGHLM